MRRRDRPSASSTSGATPTRSTATPGSSSPTPRNRTGRGTRSRRPTIGIDSSRHQPDLNYDNPRVVEEIVKVMHFWLDMGVDGLRLDAIPYLIERDGTNCENLPETHTLIKAIRREMDAKHANRMILAEANQWPADVRPYFGDGDECHMAFHFPLMPRIFMGLRLEDRLPDHRHHGADAADSRQLPVGALSPQSRRADAGNGHGGRARLHVPRLQRRPADAAQPRHPPAPGAAAGQQPSPHRAAEQPAPLVPRHAHHLLRRRDRDGRQHLSRRPQRRAHADAVERRPQRGVLPGQSGPPLQPGHHGSGLRLRGG